MLAGRATSVAARQNHARPSFFKVLFIMAPPINFHGTILPLFLGETSAVACSTHITTLKRQRLLVKEHNIDERARLFATTGGGWCRKLHNVLRQPQPPIEATITSMM